MPNFTIDQIATLLAALERYQTGALLLLLLTVPILVGLWIWRRYPPNDK